MGQSIQTILESCISQLSSDSSSYVIQPDQDFCPASFLLGLKLNNLALLFTECFYGTV